MIGNCRDIKKKMTGNKKYERPIRSEVRDVMSDHRAPYGAVLDVERFRTREGKKSKLGDNVKAAAEHAIKDLDTEHALYIMMSVEKKRAIWPPDETAEMAEKPESESVEEKKIRLECNHKEAIRVKRENKARC